MKLRYSLRTLLVSCVATAIVLGGLGWFLFGPEYRLAREVLLIYRADSSQVVPYGTEEWKRLAEQRCDENDADSS